MADSTETISGDIPKEFFPGILTKFRSTVVPESKDPSPHNRVKNPEHMINGLLFIKESLQPQIETMETELVELARRIEIVTELKRKYERVVAAVEDE